MSFTTATKDFAISLSPQTQGRWKVDLTHIPSRYSPPWPVWQSSLDAAKIRALLCIEDAFNDPDPNLSRALRPNRLAEALQIENIEGTPADYLNYARRFNFLAGEAINLPDMKDVGAQDVRVSVGLSLHAARLLGEGILRALGWTVSDIQECRNHDLPTLLRQAEQAIQKSPIKKLAPFRHFTLVTPTIDEVKMGNTIAAYLQSHFKHTPSAFLEDYFYPDKSTSFALPRPIQAMFLMVEQLLTVAEQILVIAL